MKALRSRIIRDNKRAVCVELYRRGKRMGHTNRRAYFYAVSLAGATPGIRHNAGVIFRESRPVPPNVIEQRETALDMAVSGVRAQLNI